MASPPLLLIRRVAAALALVASAAAAEPAPEPVSDDPRVEQADSLLGDAENYDRAIALYEAALAEDPDDHAARLRLARVLAWSQRYDEALAHVDRLLAAPDPPQSAAVERAEFLSWSGRYAEAEDAFEPIVADDPKNVRAALGLARVYRWSGRRARAETAYRNALEIADDAEARAELERLRASHRPWLRPYVEYVWDNDDFAWLRSGAEAAYWRNATTSLRARAGYQRASRSQRKVPAAARARHSSDEAADVGLGVDHVFERGVLGTPLRVSADAGARLWQHAGVTPTARLRAEANAGPATSLGIEAHTGEMLDDSHSFEALQRRLMFAEVSADVWRSLGAAWDAYASFGYGFVEGGNRRHSLGASVGWNPIDARPTRLSLGVHWYGYERSSPYYYDPSLDLGGMLRVSDRFDLGRGFYFQPRLGIGTGRTRDSGDGATGVTFEAGGEVGWHWGPWYVALAGSHSQSLRASRYVTDHVVLRITREFSQR